MGVAARGVQVQEVGDRIMYVAFDGINESPATMAFVRRDLASPATDEAFGAWLDVLCPPPSESSELAA